MKFKLSNKYISLLLFLSFFFENNKKSNWKFERDSNIVYISSMAERNVEAAVA